MSDRSLTILAIGDLHYSNLAQQRGQTPPSRGELARTLLKKVFLRLEHMGVKPDVAVVLGDLTENGDDPAATVDLVALYGELSRTGVPFLTLPGNHDLDTAHFNDRFGTPAGLYRFGGYGLVVLNDIFKGVSHECIRPAGQFNLLRDIHAKNPNLPLVALQHAPVYPPIDSHYPYRPQNVAEIIESYENNGVVLSLSAHYHPGQRPRFHNEVMYHTVASLSEPPFHFSLIRLEGPKVEIEEQTLALKLPDVPDVHCHTEYAYCGTTIDTAPSIALAEAMGVQTLCLTEHAFHLYFGKHDALDFEWMTRPEMVERAWASPGRFRMEAYRRYVERLRSPFIKLGLELDLYGDGQLLLAPEDAAFDWDVLIGAIHRVAGFERGKTPQAEAEKLFMRDLEYLVGYDIHVLAHPFRFFAKNGLKIPVHLYDEVAGLLSDNNVAAEVNYHTPAYKPDPEFIRICVEKDVKIALASDSHDLSEVGEFWPHLNVLRKAGVTPKTFADTLFRLKQSAD
ncbi:MAG: metallophosphoesterase [Kiritimatiellae bacterium]|nr:metallophosphoesterase [Kiritimatiellia bacterium]